MARLPIFAALAITLAVSALSCGTCPPFPSIASISPASATAGVSQFLLTVNGNDFRRDALVSWNGAFRVTTFVSTHQLRPSLPLRTSHSRERCWSPCSIPRRAARPSCPVGSE